MLEAKKYCYRCCKELKLGPSACDLAYVPYCSYQCEQRDNLERVRHPLDVVPFPGDSRYDPDDRRDPGIPKG